MKYLIAIVGGLMGAIAGSSAGTLLTEIVGNIFFPGPAGLLAGLMGIHIFIPLGIAIGFILGMIISLKIYNLRQAKDVNKHKHK